MNKTHLWPEQTVEIDGITTISVTIETPDKIKIFSGIKYQQNIVLYSPQIVIPL